MRDIDSCQREWLICVSFLSPDEEIENWVTNLFIAAKILILFAKDWSVLSMKGTLTYGHTERDYSHNNHLVQSDQFASIFNGIPPM